MQEVLNWPHHCKWHAPKTRKSPPVKLAHHTNIQTNAPYQRRCKTMTKLFGAPIFQKIQCMEDEEANATKMLRPLLNEGTLSLCDGNFILKIDKCSKCRSESCMEMEPPKGKKKHFTLHNIGISSHFQFISKKGVEADQQSYVTPKTERLTQWAMDVFWTGSRCGTRWRRLLPGGLARMSGPYQTG